MNAGEIPDAPAVGAFAASSEGWAFAGALTLDDAAKVLEASQALPLPANGVVDFGGLMQADAEQIQPVFYP